MIECNSFWWVFAGKDCSRWLTFWHAAQKSTSVTRKWTRPQRQLSPTKSSAQVIEISGDHLYVGSWQISKILTQIARNNKTMHFFYPHVKLNTLDGNNKWLKFLPNITVQIQTSRKWRLQRFKAWRKINYSLRRAKGVYLMTLWEPFQI